jgi:hypothetical protein
MLTPTSRLNGILVLSLVSLIITSIASGQDRVTLPRLEHPLVFDGIISDTAWETITPLPLITFDPVYGDPPNEKTDIRLAYDSDYLYLGAKLHDSHPEKMKIQFKRDDWKYSCDWVMLRMDTYRDNENTIVFATSPSGGRTDVSFSNDVSDLMQDMNLSWNTFWDVKSAKHPDGWSTEMRIPFSSLRFRDENGQVVMGLSVMRYIPNLNETYVFPEMDVKHGFWGTFKASQTGEVVFEGIDSPKPLYITPYLLGGLGHQFELNEEGTDYKRQTNKTWGIGLDAKYRLTDFLTMDLSLNTDFAQVEADDQVVNLTRFSLFFPEKRLFFQERRSNFEFNFDLHNRLFYTRRIGIHDGNPVPIYGGIRLVGRVRAWDVGFLSMQSAPVEDLYSENFVVMRLRRQVINANTYVGGIITNRMDFKGNYNTAYGVDGIFRLFGDDYLKAMWAQTFETGNMNNPLSLEPARIYLNWERRSNKGFAYNLSYSRAGEQYHPGIGFELREDYSKYGAKLLYGWILENKWIRSHQVHMDGYLYSSHISGQTESAEVWLGWEFLSRARYNGIITVKAIYDHLTEAFYLSDNDSVPEGSYRFTNLVGDFSTPPGRDYGISTVFEVGPYYDGWLYSVGVTPRAILLNRIELRTTYQFNRVQFPTREMQFDAHIVRLNALLSLNTKLSVSAFVQYNSSIDAVLSNIRLRYNPREGNDFYIVYNEGYNTDRYREDPGLPVTSERTLMVKYTYTFIF